MFYTVKKNMWTNSPLYRYKNGSVQREEHYPDPGGYFVFIENRKIWDKFTARIVKGKILMDQSGSMFWASDWEFSVDGIFQQIEDLNYG